MATCFNDRTGRSFVPAEVAAAVARRANAPLQGLYEAHLRLGLMGGSVVRTAAVGQRAGEIAIELLSGARSIDLVGAEVIIPPQPMFDWAQHKRWGADPASLPVVTLFLNRPSALWSDYRAAFIVAGAALLLVNHRRKQAESTLRESEQRLHLAAEGAQFGVVELDFAAGTSYCSKEFRQLVGVSADYSATAPDLALEWVHPDDRAALQDRLSYQKSAQGNGIIDDLFRVKRPDGEVCWLQVTLLSEGSRRMETVHRRKDGSHVPVEVTVHSFCMTLGVGCQVEVTGNGAEAVEQVQQARYDLVLMDMQMPVMDRLEATRRIRALPGMDKLPIIAMTANALSTARRIADLEAAGVLAGASFIYSQRSGSSL